MPRRFGFHPDDDDDEPHNRRHLPSESAHVTAQPDAEEAGDDNNQEENPEENPEENQEEKQEEPARADEFARDDHLTPHQPADDSAPAHGGALGAVHRGDGQSRGGAQFTSRSGSFHKSYCEYSWPREQGDGNSVRGDEWDNTQGRGYHYDETWDNSNDAHNNDAHNNDNHDDYYDDYGDDDAYDY